jgi:radical SAM-linked protein
MRLRITFTKQGALRYTGHLDLHKLWERTARRAELPLAYSLGFHPQPKMNIAAALPLGFSSRCEVLDMRLQNDILLDGLCEKLQATLPAGIRVLNVERVDDGEPALQTQVTAAEYEVALKEPIDGPELERRIETLMGTGTLPRQRRGKNYDLRPLIEDLSLNPTRSPLEGRGSVIFMRLAAREGATGRPEEVVDSLGIPFEETRIERTKLIFMRSPAD